MHFMFLVFALYVATSPEDPAAMKNMTGSFSNTRFVMFLFLVSFVDFFLFFIFFKNQVFGKVIF